MEIHVATQPVPVFFLGNLVVTNTLLTSWIAVILLIVLALLATRRMQLIPTGFQNVAETILEALLSISESATGPRARGFLPLVATLFLYILTANWLGIFPGVGTIPVLRTANSDLSITAAMAIIVFVWVQVTALRTDPKAYFLKFLWPPFIGQLEIISEIARPVSLAMRLFGNILAGFVLVEVMLQLEPLGLPAVFMGLELGVGLLQALVFAILTLAFLSLASTSHSSQAHATETAREATH